MEEGKRGPERTDEDSDCNAILRWIQHLLLHLPCLMLNTLKTGRAILSVTFDSESADDMVLSHYHTTADAMDGTSYFMMNSAD